MEDTRIPAREAGYMELLGATKDSDCSAVRVPGGISLELGCCNHFQPEDRSVQEFECGECRYHMSLENEATGDSFNEPLSSDDTSTPSFPTYGKGGSLKGSHAAMPFKIKQVKVKSATLARAINQSKRARQSNHRYGS